MYHAIYPNTGIDGITPSLHIVYRDYLSMIVLSTVHVFSIAWYKTVTVEPRSSIPRLTRFLNYPDFFSSPKFVRIFINHD